MKEIKTKQTLKDIKVLDKTAEVSHRVKNAYIRTKEQAEQPRNDEDGNYVDDAANSVRESTETVARKAVHTAESYGKRAFKKIKERRAPDTDTPCSDAPNGEYTRQTSKSKAKKTVHRDVVPTETKQAAEQSISPFKAKKSVRQNAPHSLERQTAKPEVKYTPAQPGTTGTENRRFTLAKPNELAKCRFVQNSAKQRLTRKIEIQTAGQKAAQMQLQPTFERITAPAVQRPHLQPAEKTIRQTTNPSGTVACTIRQTVDSGGKTIKEAYKGTVKVAQKSVKTAEHTAKAAVKTSQAAAKTAAKTAQAAQTAARTARIATRMAAISAKAAVKAMIATVKVIIVTAKSLISLIAAGGWIAVVVILVICLAGLLLGSVFGIFYSNESPRGNAPVMTEVVSQLNNEFAAKIQQIEDENSHDTLDLSNNGSSTIVGNWRDILAVYAVKVTADSENGMEVATLDDTKVGILRNIFWDMNKIDYRIETIEHEETATSTDKDGNDTEEAVTITEIVLHIYVTSKSSSDMISEYSFNAEQVKILNELMKNEYQQFFIQLTGN